MTIKSFQGQVATVKLSRPDIRNAFNDEVIAELTQALKGGATNWLYWIVSLSVEKLEDMLGYATMRGMPAALPFAATLAYVFNHGRHHRGQITRALTMLGKPCPELDLVYMLQEESKG